MDFNKTFDTILMRRDPKDTSKVNAYYPITHTDNIDVDTYDGIPEDVHTLTDLLKKLNEFAYTGITITKENIDLGNVTNDKQVKGISGPVGENHVVVFGEDGYTIKDGGHTVEADVPADAVFTDTTYDDASDTTKGVVQLSNSIDDASTELVPTTEVTYKLYSLIKKAITLIETGNANGTINVDGKDVPVAGLRSAAFKKAGEFATNRQGKLADNAVQRSGDTISGALLTERTIPTEDNEFVPKSYVDNLISSISSSSLLAYCGTLGTVEDNAEWTALPTKGLVKGLGFKVISNGTYAGYECTVGDMIVSKVEGKADATTETWSRIKGNDQTLTTIEINDGDINITTAAKSGAIHLGSTASKKSITELTENGTDEEIPTAKAIIDYITSKNFLQQGLVVSGIKGSNETSFRTGEVSLSAADVGAATQEQGQKADTAIQSFKIGTVKTGDAGTTASALVHKDSENNAILDLVIPKGKDGETGATPNFQIGDVTSVDSDVNPTVLITGTKDAPILNFTIPRGLTGKGETGDAGSIDEVHAKLLPAGSLPTVTNTGTNQNAILTFGIPTGDKGDPGDPGEKGDKGDPGNLWYIGYGINVSDENFESQESFVYPDSAIETARIGDCYFNVIHDGIYQCTLGGDPNTAKWKFCGTTKGKQGDPGLSTYDIAVKNGFVGTENDFIKGITNPKNVDVANYIFKVCKSFSDYAYNQRLHPTVLTKALISFIDDDGSIIPYEDKSGLLKFMNDRGIPLGVALSKDNFDNAGEKIYYSLDQLHKLVAKENEIIMTGHKDSDYNSMSVDDITSEITEVKELFTKNNFDAYSFAYPGDGLQYDATDFSDKIKAIYNQCEFAFTGVSKLENKKTDGYDGRYNEKTLGYWTECPFNKIEDNIRNNLIIPRLEISADHHLQTYNVNEIIDKAIQNKGYICFHFSSSKGTFLENGAETNGSDRVKEIIQYIIDNYGTTVDFVSPTFAGERIMRISTNIDDYHDLLTDDTYKQIADHIEKFYTNASDVSYNKNKVDATNVQDAIDRTNDKITNFTEGIDSETVKKLSTSDDGKLLFDGKLIETELLASKVKYDNTNSHMKSDNLQDAVDSLKFGMDNIENNLKSSKISYDNSSSGATATNIQDAIDENFQKNKDQGKELTEIKNNYVKTRDITEDDYDALPNEKTSDNTLYIIKDGVNTDDIPSSAEAKIDYLYLSQKISFPGSCTYSATKIKKYYAAGYWSNDNVKLAVKNNWITSDDYKAITSEEYTE